MKRSTPLRRRTPLRAKSRRKAARWAHLRDPQYLAWVRSQPCVGREFPAHECWGPIDASHTGRKPAAYVKAGDQTAIPKCRRLHIQWHAWSGPFKGWDAGWRALWATTHLNRLHEAYHRVLELGEVA